MAVIARLSKKFKWPSWVIYDLNFRQEAADSGLLDWSKIDGGIHAQCFNEMSLSAEGWCTICNSMDHPSDEQPSPKRPLAMKTPNTKPAKRSRIPGSNSKACRKWNRLNTYIDCPFGDSCIYRHVCAKCFATDNAAVECVARGTTKPPR